MRPGESAGCQEDLCCQDGSRQKDQNIEKPEAEKLGQINALVIEAAEGKVHAVMGFGRLGARDTYFSVPWSA